VPAGPPRSADAVGRRLALQLWACSIVCWWVLGIPFSRLWWLVNAKQLHWIFICYAWEVPVVGWTGAVLVPWLLWRRLTRSLSSATLETLRRLARFPVWVASLVLGASTVGYLLGALQIRHMAALPLAEAAKIVIQGPVLGALFGVAAYFLAERAIRTLELPRSLAAGAAREPGVLHSLYGKVFSITLALTLGTAAPLLLYGLTQRQLDTEEQVGRRLDQVIAPVRTLRELEGAMRAFGPDAYGLVFRRSNNFIVGGAGTGRVLPGDGQADFARYLTAGGQGHFAGRDGTHKVVGFNTVPGLLPDGDDAVFVGVVPMTDYGSALAASGGAVLLIGAVSLLLGLGLAAMLAHSIVDPIRKLQSATARMAAGDLAIDPVGVAGGDEVALLARQFDGMAQRVHADERSLRAAYDALQAAQDRLVQAEKLAAAGRVVSGVAHELNNPLSAILHFVEDLLADDTLSPTDREALTAVSLQARRARKIVRDLLAFVRRREYRGAPADLEQVLRHTVAGLRPELDRLGTRLEVTVEPGLPPVLIDPAALEQVITNLVINGAQAAGPTGIVWVRARMDRGCASVQVEDDGPGIAPEALPHVFEPFYTTKAPGQGTGLGLSVSLGIATQYGGSLEAENRAGGRGARFSLWLPPAPDGSVPADGDAALRDAARHARVSPPPEAPEGRREPRVLVVDDEEPIRTALQRYFQRHGWVVDEAEDGAAGLDKLLGDGDAYDLILTDLKMPRLSGIELHDRLARERPKLFRRLIVMTGDVASPEAAVLLARTDRPVIEKPFELAELARVIGRVTG